MHTSPIRPSRSLRARGARAVLVAALFLLILVALAGRADAAVYWGNQAQPFATPPVPSSVGRANLDGTGINRAFIGGDPHPCGVASDGTHVYWTNGTNQSIGRANLDGSGVNQNFIPGVQSCALAVDAAHIYWDNRDGSIGRANLDGSGVNQTFIPQVGAVFGLAVDQAHVYWSTFGSIGRANLDGSGANQNLILADPLSDMPCGVAADAGHLYWANSFGTIGRANLDGTFANPNFVQVRPPVDSLTCGVAVDSAHLYWGHTALNSSEAAGDGIGRANLDGTGVNLSFITAPIGAQVAVDAATQAEQRSRFFIDDVRMAEGDAGQTAFRFTVSLDRAQSAPVTVDFATADDTATAAEDYAAANGTLTFAAGETTKTVTVQVNGDTSKEDDETFDVNLTNATGNATIADGQGVGTIVNDDQPVLTPPSRISINDVSIAEGDAGQTAFRFAVSLDQPQSARVAVDFATADGTAIAPGDYTPTAGTLTFAAGETTKTVTVQVNGDTTVEPDERFNVNLTNANGNATIADATGVATIANDDQPVIEQPSRVSIGDMSMAEGNAGQTAFRFTAALDAPQSAPVTVDVATADGSATAPGDYAPTTGTLTFAPGETAKTVTVQVNADTQREPDETFSVNLSHVAGNATIADGHAVGTIVNDDRKGKPGKFALGGARLNPRTGTARLAVTVPGPGTLAISGPGVKAAGARMASTVHAAGAMRLLIGARGRQLRTLNRTGAVTITPKLTYTPIDGTPHSRSKHLRLQKR